VKSKLTVKRPEGAELDLTRIALIITNFLLIEPPMAQIFADEDRLDRYCPSDLPS
jgi:hypothetical protein